MEKVIGQENPTTLKEQLEARLMQLEHGRKRAESEYYEITGMISECNNTLSLITASEQEQAAKLR